MIEQGTDEWEQARLGRATASRIADLAMQTKRGEWLASRRSYMLELIAERLTGMRADPYLSAPMLFGIESEPLARSAYAALRGAEVMTAGFVAHPAISMSGASPDGFVGETGLIEIKCPNTKGHVTTLIDRIIPERHQFQLTWQLACCPDTEWVDYVSFDSRVPVEYRLAVIRFPRNPKHIAGLERVVKEFLTELDNTMGQLEAGEISFVPQVASETSRVVRAEHMGSEDISASLTKPTPPFTRKS